MKNINKKMWVCCNSGVAVPLEDYIKMPKGRDICELPAKEQSKMPEAITAGYC